MGRRSPHTTSSYGTSQERPHGGRRETHAEEKRRKRQQGDDELQVARSPG